MYFAENILIFLLFISSSYNAYCSVTADVDIGKILGHDASKRMLTAGRIVGGSNVTNKTTYPSIAYLSSVATGTLIHPDAVLTSAQLNGIFIGKNLYIGGTFHNGSDATETIQVIREIPNQKYNFPKNDIMIVFLSKTSTAPIQKLNYNTKVPANMDSLTVIGYGYPVANTTNSSENTILQQVSVAASTCNAYGITYATNPYLLCAGSTVGGQGICSEDAGAPLLTTDGTQVGLATFFNLNGCGTSDFPDGYTRISYYKEWIHKTLCLYSSVVPKNCKCSYCGILNFACRRRFNCRGIFG